MLLSLCVRVCVCMCACGGGAGKGVLDLAAYYLLCKHGLSYFGGGGAACDGADDDLPAAVKMTEFSHARLVKRRRAADTG